MKVRCFDYDARCKQSSTVLPVRLFAQTANDDWASIGASVANRIRIERFSVASPVRDLLRICLAVVAADHGVSRKTAQDGWTRQIELEIPVERRKIWIEFQSTVERMLKFLTGDIWKLKFKSAKAKLGQDKKEPRYLKGDTISLLSGGADSLVGALDLSKSGKEWTAISQTSSDTKVQHRFGQVAGATRHLQWTHGVQIPYDSEGSQRARSMIFFAFALVAAVSTEAYHSGQTVTIHASENGLISLNPPLTPTRIGSASTRTTHPCFIGQFQALLDRLEIHVKLKNDYQLLTKGEMFLACKRPDDLRTLVVSSMSCGKGGRINMHCGRCVPCIIRRAAFKKGQIRDTTNYQFDVGSDGFKKSDDVRCAYIGSANHANRKWVENAVLPSLFECDISDRKSLVDVAQRGLKEVHDFVVRAI